MLRALGRRGSFRPGLTSHKHLRSTAFGLHAVSHRLIAWEVRCYVRPPGGGVPGGGLSLGNIFGPQHQKGEALKEYVSPCITASVSTTEPVLSERVLICPTW